MRIFAFPALCLTVLAGSTLERSIFQPVRAGETVGGREEHDVARDGALERQVAYFAEKLGLERFAYLRAGGQERDEIAELRRCVESRGLELCCLESTPGEPLAGIACEAPDVVFLTAELEASASFVRAARRAGHLEAVHLASTSWTEGCELCSATGLDAEGCVVAVDPEDGVPGPAGAPGPLVVYAGGRFRSLR